MRRQRIDVLRRVILLPLRFLRLDVGRDLAGVGVVMVLPLAMVARRQCEHGNTGESDRDGLDHGNSPRNSRGRVTIMRRRVAQALYASAGTSSRWVVPSFEDETSCLAPRWRAKLSTSLRPSPLPAAAERPFMPQPLSDTSSSMPLPTSLDRTWTSPV